MNFLHINLRWLFLFFFFELFACGEKSSSDLIALNKGESLNIQPSVDIFFHRLSGRGRKIPENSLAGLVFALEKINAAKFGHLEFDIQYVDGHLILLHDQIISRELFVDENGLKPPRQAVSKIGFDTLRKYKFKHSEHIPPISDPNDLIEKLRSKNGIATLEEFITLLNEWETRYLDSPPPTLFIEMKSIQNPYTFAIALLNFVDIYNLEKRVIIQSFDGEAIKTTKAIAKNLGLDAIKFAYLWGRTQQLLTPWRPRHFLKWVKKYNADILSPQYQFINKKEISELHAEDIEVIPWTINHPKDMQKQFTMGIDGIISDFGEVAQTEILQFDSAP